MPNCIPLDPKLPANFDITPNEKRSKAQLDAWWDRPYGITTNDGQILVYCLNGGAWDRPTCFGKASNYYEACELAEIKQSQWAKTRAQPIFMHSFEPPFYLIRQSQRPDHPQTVIGEFDTLDEMNLFTLQQKGSMQIDVPPTLDHNRMNLQQLAWYSNELAMGISKLGNEANSLAALRDIIIARIREVQNG